MSEYKPVTVDAARQLAEAFEKAVVVVFAIDAAHEKSHVTTYGQTPDQKIYAAKLGETLGRILELQPRETYEDFRDRPAAEGAAARERLAAVEAELETAAENLSAAWLLLDQIAREEIACLPAVREAAAAMLRAQQCQGWKGEGG